jgi:hypothetical protein
MLSMNLKNLGCYSKVRIKDNSPAEGARLSAVAEDDFPAEDPPAIS